MLRRLLPDGLLRLRWVLVTVTAVAFAVVLTGLIDRGFDQVDQARAERARLLEEQAMLEREVAHLKRTLEALESDPDAVEALARQELGWIRPGEQVLVLPAPTPVPSILTEPAPTPILSIRR
jgi:cell division protein FtsB